MALSLALVVGVAGPATAQETLVIGDDKPGSTPSRSDTPDIVINSDVLDNLGTPDASAPVVPYSATGVSPTLPGQTSLIAPGAPGTAYRLPDTGQLVISRPSTLLFPPQQFPQSRLTVPVPEGRAAARAKSMPEPGTAQSRLPVPKPAAPAPVAAPLQPTEPAAPLQPVAQAPVTAMPSVQPEPAPAPTAMPEPAPPPVAAMTPAAEPAPTAEAPAPPAMATEMQPAAPVGEPSAPTASAPEPAPEPEPAAAKAPESQSAALTPAPAASETRVLFGDGSAELTAQAIGQLDALATELLRETEARVQLLAYAKASDDGSSKARRLSLSRALAVRAHLIEKGVRSTRMDVRALGSGSTEGPADRVDILPQETAQ